MKRRCFHLLMAAALAVVSVSAHAQDEELPKASPAKAEPTKAVPVQAAEMSAKARPLSVTVGLVNDSKIEGTLTDTTQLQMQTSFGTASIPLSEVAGIRFASANDATTTVVMLNGDSITGATDVKLITVETEWGTASINGPSIASLMFVPGLNWNPSDGLNGKRWNLSDIQKQDTPSRPTVNSPTGQSSNRAPSPQRPGTSVPSINQQFFPNR
ncbi:putative signal peptide and transmembrane protein [Rhodopirellula islandica]|uniref:Signal peptide and transmembrane protein n=1 Tax=Rhodopirellula islandica TaxID=595434 RepID=A0A0J1BBY8_RHOIS|nr:hypothetical protein [Rhodopirellula islandica]KLU04026.1 putative signal peptide and transmembrane protein [Rhodopirellula islandica]